MASSKGAKDIKKGVFTRKEEDLQLKQQLLLGPELLISPTGEDKNLDRLSLKLKLLSGEEFPLSEYLSERMLDYSVKFIKDYYYQIARLRSIEKSLMDVYRKPAVVAKITNEFIYGRFPYKVLRELRSRNAYIAPGVRAHKHFQYLSEAASEQLDVIIGQAVETMKTCETWPEFKLKYSEQYKVYLQIDMYEDEI